MQSDYKVAGVLGFEPRYAEIKTRCLTAWRHPNWEKQNIKAGYSTDSISYVNYTVVSGA